MALVDKILDLHLALRAADLDHAFGGALALAWCTERARGTIDIDLNVFVDQGDADRFVSALPDAIEVSDVDVERLVRDGQVRLWWESTPLDVFMNTTEFHMQVATRARTELFLGHDVPFLACSDLAVFKAFFNRTKDWADLEEMMTAGTLDIDRVLGVLVRYLGPTDERVTRLRSLA